MNSKVKFGGTVEEQNELATLYYDATKIPNIDNLEDIKGILQENMFSRVIRKCKWVFEFNLSN
ncbi:hypothetical protein ACWN6Y_08070 [Vagococcus teuberi]|uniref:Uncharacterized protein n=1 Tax=Vagococcus teuberi TaxID=519472 RepID=A0A1J0A3E2_9ENTE|nr:hypothetical protein [Vagococcus teuberi]APB30434.1 hypothetical protein BHY08_00365 [Vagococcus teuberi]